VEEALFESNMDFTILQPATFIQNIDNIWSVIKETQKVFLAYSKYSKMNNVDYRDVAEIIAIAFTEERLNSGTFELSPAGTYNQIELDSMMDAVLNTEITVEEISFEKFAKSIGSKDDFVVNGLKNMFNHYDQYGLHGGNSLILETILGRKPTSLQEFLSDLEKNVISTGSTTRYAVTIGYL